MCHKYQGHVQEVDTQAEAVPATAPEATLDLDALVLAHYTSINWS